MKKKLMFILPGLLLVGLIVFFVMGTYGEERQPMETPRGSQPRYSQVQVDTVDGLLNWIQTVDADTFQGGRYTQVVSLLRASGQTLVPTFDIPGIELRIITVLQDDALLPGRTAMSYLYFTPADERLFASIATLTLDQVEQANQGIREYAATLDDAWLDATLSEATIQIVTENGIRTETVQTLIYSASDNPDLVNWTPPTSILFLVDDFHIMIRQDRDNFREDVLSSLRLELVAIG